MRVVCFSVVLLFGFFWLGFSVKWPNYWLATLLRQDLYQVFSEIVSTRHILRVFCIIMLLYCLLRPATKRGLYAMMLPICLSLVVCCLGRVAAATAALWPPPRVSSPVTPPGALPLNPTGDTPDLLVGYSPQTVIPGAATTTQES